MTLRIGIDVGGTFTDFIAYDPDGHTLHEHKVLTTPHDPSRSILAGLAQLLAEAGFAPAALRDATIVHGTTLAVNALIERRGARTGLVTSQGARDVLETGKENRYDPYDRQLRRPAPLVPRPWRRTLEERLLADGTTFAALDRDEVAMVLRELAAEGVEAVAVCLLHSYASPHHEQAVRAVAESLGLELYLSLSSEVAPEIGEFGRATTTAANAYVQPIVEGYLRSLRGALADAGHQGDFFLMWSDGGLASIEATLRTPIRLLESGPAAGALAAGYDAAAAGLERVVAFDMGGTTTKVCLVRQAVPGHSAELEVGRIHRDKPGSGVTVRIPSIALLEIGAGGGSLANVDELGFITVGPQSAGADPGPACYGLGGSEPTVTDANLALGYLAAQTPLAGDLELDDGLAQQALEGLAGSLQLSVEEIAKRVRRLANEKMAQAIRLHVTELGEDPRDYQLLAFGGAAPLHAYDVARALGIEEVRLSRRAGVFAAFGFLTAPAGLTLVQTVIAPLRALPRERLAASAAELRMEALTTLASAGLTEAEVELHYALDMRYRGQGYDVTVPVGATLELDPDTLATAFETAYRRRYGVHHRGAIEIRACRLSAHGPAPDLNVRPPPSAGAVARPARTRRVWFDETDAWIDAPAIAFDELQPADERHGPVVIEAAHTTYVVGPAGTVSRTADGDLVMWVRPQAASGSGRATRDELEIVIARLRAIADEADRALLRTAFSSVVRDTKDYSLVIADPAGRCLALPTECMPLFVTSMPRTIALLAKQFPPASLEPGDVLITNDPWLCAGHKSDIVLVAPVFHRDALVAFVGTILHVTDIGGTLGDFRAWDIYEEGLALPPLKLYQGGRLNHGVEAILLANIRIPDEVQGDITAMRAAIEVASQRLVAMLEGPQPPDLGAVAEKVSERAQGALRRRIGALPAKAFSAALTIDGPPGDSPDGYPPIRLALSATVEDDELILDFSGTDPQQPRQAVNVPLSSTMADAIYAVQYLFTPDMPNIGPQFSPVRVRAPEGSILNARPPVPVYARTRTGLHISTLFNAAVAEAVPDLVQAASGHNVILTISGQDDDGAFFKLTLIPKGGMGATGGRDGWNCTVFPTNCTMIATEVAERKCPVLVTREFRRDSGGPGRERGGVGQLMTLRSLGDAPLILSFRPNFVNHPPIGLLGGHPGAATNVEIDGEPPPENPTILTPGGLCRVWTAGGGGIGDPLERPATRVAADVATGLVSPEQAREAYGVVLDPASGKLDAAGTKVQRRQ